MKFATCVVIFAGLAALASAADARQVYVPGFYRPNGVWVPPHYRTVPDGTDYVGPADPNVNPYNVNPYTGAVNPYTGAVNPYTGGVVPPAYPYGYPYQSPAPYVPPPGSAVPPVPYYGAP